MNAPTQLPAHIRAIVVKPIGTHPPLRVHGTFYNSETGVLTIGVTLPDAPLHTADAAMTPTADEIFAELERKAHLATELRIAELRGKMDAAAERFNRP